MQQLPLLILTHESASKKLQLCEMNIYKNELLSIYGSICITHLHHTNITGKAVQINDDGDIISDVDCIIEQFKLILGCSAINTFKL